MQRIASRPLVLFALLATVVFFSANRDRSGRAAPQAADDKAGSGVQCPPYGPDGNEGFGGQGPLYGSADADAPVDLDANEPWEGDYLALEDPQSPFQQPFRRRTSNVYKAQIDPHWFNNNTRFWYRNDLRGGRKEFIVVDAEKATRQPAFDHEKLAGALTSAAKTEARSDRLPFDVIVLSDDAKTVHFKVGDTAWKCDLSSYECAKDDSPPEFPRSQPRLPDGRRPGFGRRPSGPRGEGDEARSPDGQWTAFVKDANVFLRPAAGGDEIQLSTDGKTGLAYGTLQFSPDSAALAAFRVEPGDNKEVYLIESSPQGGGRAKLHTRAYALPGDKYPSYELNVFDVASRKQTKPEVDRVDFGRPRVRWSRDGKSFTYEKVDRGHQRFRLIEVDAATGESRTIIDEKTDTFIWTAHTENLGLRMVTWLEKTDEIIYVSERDGWRHLYLVDAKTGDIKPITKGQWLVRGVDRIDEDARQIWFRAGGIHPDQDPYFIHYCRVNFDGSGLAILTAGNGTHTVQYSPDRKHLIATYSRVDQPPAHELRSAEDGKLIYELERADASEAEERGFKPPEVFVAKGRDGQTDIWGIITRPRNFDPAKKYPVLEYIYAGPQGSFVPKSFSGSSRFAALTDLGFIVVQIDGMGTANRSKAFHDVCWKNIKDAGFPDRILWHKAVAEKYPYYDISRVGIYGGSAGGQNATAAVLFHPEFYKAAVSGCGCHDNRMDKASWNEQWMGYPVGPQYAECSNIDNAGRLQGKLMLIVGEMDNNVPPESTFRLADALIKAGKDFDLVVVPGAGHGMGGQYGDRRMRDFFVRHLLGVEPPDRNAPRDNTARAAAEGAAAATSQPASTSAAAAADPDGLDLSDLNGASELRGVIERFEADRGNVRRSLGAASPRRDARMAEFHQQWLERLARLDFGKLRHDGKVDYLLLKNYLERELKQLELRGKTESEAAPFVPFADVIYDLDESRRQLDAMDWAKTAAALTELTKQINDARRKTESLSGEARPKRAVANRAAQSVDNLRSTLRDWHAFYNGYDPLFTWWMDEPYKAADAALSSYADSIRQRFVGGGGGGARPDFASRPESGGGSGGGGGFGGGRFSRRGESAGFSSGLASQPSRDGGDIIGNPIGREALESELAFEMIPYSPEEIVALAEQEFAWCEAEMKKASQELGFGDDWKKALEHVKNQHVEPGKQPELIRQLALEAVDYIERNDLVTVPPLCAESWRMAMMTPERQMVNPFFTGGETITVSFPTSTMPHEAKLMSMRGNNVHFARATVHHELIPGHHLQGYMISRYRTYRGPFSTAFWTEGWALYWEMLLYDMDFPRSPENRVGMLFWRMHRCARIIFSLKFHLEQMSPQECIDFLVDRVGHERDNATAEVRRSFAGSYGPLYQAAYMLGGLQFRALHRELVESGTMTNRQFHDAILKESNIPVEMVRAILTKQPLARDFKSAWKFYGPLPEAGAVEAPK